MGAYGTLDESINGLVQGLDYTTEGRFAAAEEIQFGAAVFGYVGENIKVGGYYLDVSKLVYDADLITDNVTNVTVNGVAIAPVTFLTTHDITIALIVVAINALDGVEAVLDSTDTDSRTILIRTKFAAAVAISVVTLGNTQAGASATTHSGMVFMGVSRFIQNDTGVYSLYDSVEIVTSGQISVTPVEAVEALEPAYVDNSGADIGEFSNAGFAVGARYLKNASADSITFLEVTGKSNEAYATTF